LAWGGIKTVDNQISTMKGLAVSPRHPYLFFCREDKVSRLFRERSQFTNSNSMLLFFLT
jgi:hypothetical protein